MSVPDRSGVSKDTQLYEQYVLNRTFDPKFDVMAFELLAWDPVTDSLRRVEVVQSTTNPGHYVLAVGNTDGTPISGGGTTTTSNKYDTAKYDTTGVYA